MIIRSWTRQRINFWKQAKKLRSEGYERIEADYRLQRGGLTDPKYKIDDVQISTNGKYLYYKLNQACFDHDKEMERIRLSNPHHA